MAAQSRCGLPRRRIPGRRGAVGPSTARWKPLEEMLPTRRNSLTGSGRRGRQRPAKPLPSHGGLEQLAIEAADVRCPRSPSLLACMRCLRARPRMHISSGSSHVNLAHDCRRAMMPARRLPHQQLERVAPQASRCGSAAAPRARRTKRTRRRPWVRRALGERSEHPLCCPRVHGFCPRTLLGVGPRILYWIAGRLGQRVEPLGLRGPPVGAADPRSRRAERENVTAPSCGPMLRL